jgi:hypothetical protein
MKVKISEKTAKEWEALLPINWRVGLNGSLIHDQGLGRVDVGMLFNLHGQKLYLFDEARSLLQELAVKGKITKQDKKEIKRINDILKGLEFNAQEIWGFSIDENYHNWWLDLPGCKCPPMDNMERSGTPYKVIVEDCPWHGAIHGGFGKDVKTIEI